MWQRTQVREGEVGCLIDEIQNLVEPIERLHMDVRAGPQRGRMPERRGRSRASGSPLSGAEVLRPAQAASADARPGMSCLPALRTSRACVGEVRTARAGRRIPTDIHDHYRK